MKTPKIYIAGKIGKLPESVYKTNFSQAKHEVSERGFEPVSPVDLPHDHDHSYESYMTEDLAALRNCAALYAQRNWRDSPGAIREVQEAILFSIPVVFQEFQNWDHIPATVMQ